MCADPELKAGGEPRLQLSTSSTEQGVSEEGALQGQGEVPLEARQSGCGCGLHLHQSQQHPLEGSSRATDTTVHVVFVLKCNQYLRVRLRVMREHLQRLSDQSLLRLQKSSHTRLYV